MQDRTSSPTSGITAPSLRLYYLDWLRVIATLGVFLFHASNVFNNVIFEIQNAEGSDAILFIQAFFFPWGMPLFFLVAGAGSWFALRRRTARQFTQERTFRLLVPFLTGTLLLGPLQLFLSWSHRTQTGAWQGSFLEFVADRLSYISPKLFGAIGYHMWFLDFLFAYSLLALPLFVWFKGEQGGRFISRLVGWCEHRGGILIFILPLLLVRLLLQPFFPKQQHWADFFTLGLFFILGFVVYADQRFTRLIRRDWLILLALGLVTFTAGAAIGTNQEAFNNERVPDTFPDFLFWGLITTFVPQRRN